MSGHSIYQLESDWRDENDNIVSVGSLRGQPVVMVMIYTSCQYVCPLLIQDVKLLEAELDEGMRKRATFAVVSFDPARDTPAQLASYRAKQHLEGENWVFLTGNEDIVLDLSVALGVRFRPDGRGDLLHSNIITVLDEHGVIRHRQTGIRN